MALSDTAIRKAKPAAKPFKVADSLGLYLLWSIREEASSGASNTA